MHQSGFLTFSISYSSPTGSKRWHIHGHEFIIQELYQIKFVVPRADLSDEHKWSLISPFITRSLSGRNDLTISGTTPLHHYRSQENVRTLTGELGRFSLSTGFDISGSLGLQENEAEAMYVQHKVPKRLALFGSHVKVSSSHQQSTLAFEPEEER